MPTSYKRRPGLGGRKPKHGGRALARFINEGALDNRFKVARLLKESRDLLIQDAGGPENMTNRELMLADRTAALLVITGSIESYLFGQKSLIQEDGELLPILRKSYLAYQNTLRLNLECMGLRPQKPDGEVNLADYLKDKTTPPEDTDVEAPK